MRKSSEEALYLHDLFNFARTKKNSTKHRISVRSVNNPMSHADPGYTYNAAQCPFTQPVSCDSTYKYRFIFI